MKKRIVSGMRPTGKLHLGHLVGALQNWASLQDTYDCFYFIADWHALTSDYADTSEVVSNAYDMAADWMLALTPGGVDQDLARLGHRRVRRPMFPLDDVGGVDPLADAVLFPGDAALPAQG